MFVYIVLVVLFYLHICITLYVHLCIVVCVARNGGRRRNIQQYCEPMLWLDGSTNAEGRKAIHQTTVISLIPSVDDIINIRSLIQARLAILL